MAKHLNISNLIRLLFLGVCLFGLGRMFYKIITQTTGLEMVMYKPLTIMSALLALFIPSRTFTEYTSEVFSSLIQLFLGSIVCIVLVYMLVKFQNNSPTRFIGAYSSKEGVKLEFRENNTFKAINSNMVGNSISFGDYELKDSFLILKDAVHIGQSQMRDTIWFTEKGLKFNLITPWRQIKSDTLKYMSPANSQRSLDFY